MFRGEFNYMTSYNIAVIIAGIDEGYQNAILSGIESFASDNRINTAVFVSFSGVMGNQRHDAGEFNIFNLPDFTKFDGAILLTNTIDYQPVINDILVRIKNAGIPVVSIDNDIPEFYHIGIDNVTAMRRITEHLISEHNCSTFKYVSGPKDNPESKARLASFLDVLAENNVDFSMDDVFFGDFRAPSGREAAETLIKSKQQLPQALVCANDVMAVSAVLTLNSAGIRVPEDIIVTGFDNTYSYRSCPTQLTSVERPLKRSGELACSMLLKCFTDVPQERSIILDMYPHFTESCGCGTINPNNENLCDCSAYRTYNKFESTSDHLSLINRMSCQLVECDTLKEYVQALKPFISETNAEEFYLCICDDWNSENETDGNGNSTVTVSGYTQNMFVPLAYKNGEFQELPDFPSSDILPGLFRNSDKGRFYFFIPLHFRERCLGYMAIMNSRFPLENSMFQTWCITLSNMLENIRKIICLDHAVQKLDKLYTIDTLSGIYNRNGFVINTEHLFNSCIHGTRPVMLMFLDMDELKYINDNYGHSTGDEAIHDIAEVIRSSCQNGEIYCRFGGDEFIIFAADYTENDADELTARINRNIQILNSSRKKPYTLSASIGYHITCPQQGMDVFHLVTVADNVMYENKKKKKLSKYLKNTK